MCPVLHARGRLEWQDDAPSSPKPRVARIIATRLSCVPFTAVGVAEEAFVVMLFPRSFGSTLPAFIPCKAQLPSAERCLSALTFSRKTKRIFPGSSFLRAE